MNHAKNACVGYAPYWKVPLLYATVLFHNGSCPRPWELVQTGLNVHKCGCIIFWVHIYGYFINSGWSVILKITLLTVFSTLIKSVGKCNILRPSFFYDKKTSKVSWLYRPMQWTGLFDTNQQDLWDWDKIRHTCYGPHHARPSQLFHRPMPVLE